MSKLYIEALNCYKAMVYHSGQVSGQSVRSQENKVCQSTVCKRELSQLQRIVCHRQWRHLSYPSSYSGWLKAKSEYSLACYAYGPYLRNLSKTVDGNHHTSAMKQNLCRLLRSACHYTTVSACVHRQSYIRSCSSYQFQSLTANTTAVPCTVSAHTPTVFLPKRHLSSSP